MKHPVSLAFIWLVVLAVSLLSGFDWAVKIAVVDLALLFVYSLLWWGRANYLL